MISIDFETYSEAGYIFNKNKWDKLTHARKFGLPAIGAPAYSEHETTEILSLAYGDKLWKPGMPAPIDLLSHIWRGGKIAAWNAAFEFYIWNNVCVKRYGWLPLRTSNLVDSMALSTAYGLPRSLGKCGEVLGLDIVKNTEGKRLLKKFSMPKNASKTDPRLRIKLDEDDESQLLYDYNLQDVKSEIEIRNSIPDLIETEKKLWECSHNINSRGVYIDQKRLQLLIDLVEYSFEIYTDEFKELTNGTIETVNQCAKIIGWCASRGVVLESLNKSCVIETLARNDLPADVKRILELRQLLSLTSVKKLYSIQRMVSKDSRLRDLFIYSGAERTGRFAGRGPQPQNLPSSGPALLRCASSGQLKYSTSGLKITWNSDVAEEVIERIEKRDFKEIVAQFKDPLRIASGCIRSVFSAAPGHELVCSDYNAIEAVVLACLAKEQWRIDVFKTHGMIYEMSASKITGVPFDDFIEYKKVNGEHHPLRKTIGKVAELASGFQGALGAWKQFGADKHLSENEIIAAVKAWRKASPNIVNFWYRVEDCARFAILNHNVEAEHNGIKFIVENDVLLITLLSGRKLAYHKPRLTPEGKIRYFGRINSVWTLLDTYGGKLTENIVQAIARDVLAHAIIMIANAGFNIVLHIHDEIVCEVIKNILSIEKLESLMMTLPKWCEDWPIRASGGWVGSHYRKD